MNNASARVTSRLWQILQQMTKAEELIQIEKLIM